MESAILHTCRSELKKAGPVEMEKDDESTMRDG